MVLVLLFRKLNKIVMVHVMVHAMVLNRRNQVVEGVMVLAHQFRYKKKDVQAAMAHVPQLKNY